MPKGIEMAVILVIAGVILLSQYMVYELKGTSMCTDDSATDCRIAPGDVLVAKAVKESQVREGDIICTTDNICHEVFKFTDDGFCTTGINPFAITKCYDWNELEGKVFFDIPQSFYRAVIILAIGLLIGKEVFK